LNAHARAAPRAVSGISSSDSFVALCAVGGVSHHHYENPMPRRLRRNGIHMLRRPILSSSRTTHAAEPQMAYKLLYIAWQVVALILSAVVLTAFLWLVFS
jgi:hypothetical protein